MKIKGCIFDMDGLMFDTARLEYEIMKEMGIKSEKLLSDTVGVSDELQERIFKDLYGEDFDYYAMNDRRSALLRQRVIQGGLPVKKGLYELLRTLKSYNIPAALASLSPIETVDFYLKTTNLEDTFSVVIGGDSGIRSKPDPQIFQIAAQKMGTLPEETIVLEDSLTGITAAISGGFLACMVPELQEPGEEVIRMLTARFDSLSEVIPFIVNNQNGGVCP